MPLTKREELFKKALLIRANTDIIPEDRRQEEITYAVDTIFDNLEIAEPLLQKLLEVLANTSPKDLGSVAIAILANEVLDIVIALEHDATEKIHVN